MPGPDRTITEPTVQAWNENWPAGTPVVLVNDVGEREETKTRSEAWLLGHGEAVVMVEGRTGGYLLSRVTPCSPASRRSEAS